MFLENANCCFYNSGVEILVNRRLEESAKNLTNDRLTKFKIENVFQKRGCPAIWQKLMTNLLKVRASQGYKGSSQ